MNEVSPAAWFYTRDGERNGPVPFEELQNLARAGALNPRSDHAWTQGMDTWLPAGEIDGLFERREEMPAPQAAIGAGPGVAEPQEIVLHKDSGWPGMGRAGYILIPLLLSAVWFFGITFGLPLLKPYLEEAAIAQVVLFAPWVLAIVILGVTLARFRNLGMSRWWGFGLLVPLLHLWLGYRLFACPPGYPWHKKMDGVGWFLAVIYWAVHLLALAALAAAFLIIAGSLGEGEVRQKLEEIIRQSQSVQPPAP